jgi:serine/threonine protein phosphatase PrpC
MKFTIYQDSRRGHRLSNQDRVAYSYSKDALLAVVADGMGGHTHGEIAAQFAVEVLTTSFQRLARPRLVDPFRFFEAHIRQLHATIAQHALEKEMLEIPRTTLVAALVQNDELYCAHVGDSRLYHFRHGRLLFRTEDHSKVQMLYRKGVIAKHEMLTHPERNKIYNCIGGDTEPRIELSGCRDIAEGDIVLLCTDGLWSLLEDEEMAAALQSGPVTDTVAALLDLAGTRAGQNGDNMSAIAFSWGNAARSGFSVSTAMMPLDLDAPIHNFTPAAVLDDADFTEDDIERVIAEIDTAVEKSLK